MALQKGVWADALNRLIDSMHLIKQAELMNAYVLLNKLGYEQMLSNEAAQLCLDVSWHS